MDYKKFAKIFNQIIFEQSKATLIEKIAQHPARYIGLFRPTKPKAKILQNLLQSHEIRFGDAFEVIVEEYLKEADFTMLDKNFSADNGDKLGVDQCFSKGNKTYFAEQKIRDDHDSSKKRGQIDNFEKKLNAIIQEKGENNLAGIFYFIDPYLRKNKNYYISAIKKMSKDYGIKLYLFYGVEFFEFLKIERTWAEILKFIELWKKEIPDLPETNLDLNAEHSFQEIKDINPLYFRKIFEDEEIFKEIILTLFPHKKTLKLLLSHFENKSRERTVYKTLFNLLKTKL